MIVLKKNLIAYFYKYNARLSRNFRLPKQIRKKAIKLFSNTQYIQTNFGVI